MCVCRHAHLHTYTHTQHERVMWRLFKSCCEMSRARQAGRRHLRPPMKQGELKVTYFFATVKEASVQQTDPTRGVQATIWFSHSSGTHVNGYCTGEHPPGWCSTGISERRQGAILMVNLKDQSILEQSLPLEYYLNRARA